MVKRFFDTEAAWAPLVMRLVLGGVFFPHGAQKALGWFSGPGWSGTIGFFGSMGVPAVMAALVIGGEFLGSLGLIVGLGTRLAAFGIAATMAGAIAMVHAEHGFFMNWFGNQAGEGYEYHLLAIGLAAAVFIAGAGRFSLDRLVAGVLDGSSATTGAGRASKGGKESALGGECA